MRTVLIFAHECAPYHRAGSTAGAQRPAQFAKYLPSAGWRAIVVCCDVSHRGQGTQRDFDRLGAAVSAQVRSARPGESMVIGTPSWPSDGLLDRSWRALLPSAGRDAGWRRALRKPLTAAKFITGDYSQPWQPFARRAAEIIAAEVPVDACIGEHGPDAGLFLARWFSRRYGVPWIADFRDPVLRPHGRVGRLLYAPRARRLVATAAALVEVTPAWAAAAEQQLRRPAYSIPNGFDPDEFRGAGAAARRNERLTIAYSGHVIEQQRPEMFLDGLVALRERAPAAFRDLRFRYRGGDAARVRRLAADRRLNEAVETAPHVERATALRELCDADMLLLLSVADAGDDPYLRPGLYPAKAFEYFGARRPILCVPGDGGLLDALVRATRTGASCGSPEAIAAHLRSAWEVWKAGSTLPYAPDEAELLKYTRARTSARMAALLDAAIGLRATGVRPLATQAAAS